MGRKLTNVEYEFIKAEVADLFVRFDVQCIPISGFELAIKMGITLVPYTVLSQRKGNLARQISRDGFYLEPGGGREIIYYDDSKGYGRANWTILHEIGHAVLGHTDDTDPDVVEAEANFFAKYAVAPPPLVHKLHPSCPKDIRERFSLSYQESIYAFDYYQKWLQYSGAGYTDYELALLEQVIYSAAG